MQTAGTAETETFGGSNEVRAPREESLCLGNDVRVQQVYVSCRLISHAWTLLWELVATASARWQQ